MDEITEWESLARVRLSIREFIYPSIKPYIRTIIHKSVPPSIPECGMGHYWHHQGNKLVLFCMLPFLVSVCVSDWESAHGGSQQVSVKINKKGLPSIKPGTHFLYPITLTYLQSLPPSFLLLYKNSKGGNFYFLSE